MKLSLAQYVRFLCVGGAVGLVSVLARELLARLIGDSTPLRYSASVIVAYGIGILLSFAINRTFTFGGRHGWSRLPRFIALALVGMGLSWVFSLLLRYGLSTDRWFGTYGPMAAFGASAVLASLFTYPLNAKLVFRAPHAEGRRPSGRLVDDEQQVAGPTKQPL